MITDAQQPPALGLYDIHKRFGATHALRGVSLAVRAGSIHALVGTNGAGKSTLMRILSGAERADSGRIEISGALLNAASPLAARRAGVAMIYQELSLAAHMSVAENIVLGSEPSRLGVVSRRTMFARAREALRGMGHSDIPLSARVSDLGIAQRQVVEIARALSSGCRILVLDEPTSSLSARDSERLFLVLDGLRRAGLAIVYISHVLEEVKRISDDFSVLRDGRIAGSGPTAGITERGLVELMSGAKGNAVFKRSLRRPGEVLLKCEAVSGERLPVEAGFELRRGEILGLAGNLGAGRTELLRIVAGLDPLRAGRITAGGSSGWRNAHARLRQGAGFLCEDRKTEGLALKLSIAENITLTRMNKCGGAGFVLPSLQAREARRLAGRLDIKCSDPGQAVWELSGGNQQKVAIARLLFHDCDIFLLDEPTRGVDVHSREQIYVLIDQLAGGGSDGRPRAVLLASSYLPELLALCDRIAVMRRGRLGPARPVTEWSEQSLLAETTMGREL